MKKLINSVDSIFEAHGNDNIEELKYFISKILEETKLIENSIRRNFTIILSLWAVGYLISSGIVVEGSFGSFKINKVHSLLIAWPPMVGALAYMTILGASAAAIMCKVLSRAYKNLLPKVYETDFDNILTASTFIGAERTVELIERDKWYQNMNKNWIAVVTATILFVPFVSFFHLSFVIFFLDDVNKIIFTISFILGLVFILRAGALIVAVARAMD